MFKTLKAWCLRRPDNTQPPAQKDEWEMIGEPIKAIILSMRNNPKRWRLRATSMRAEESTTLRHWERSTAFLAYQLSDRLTGKDFRVLWNSQKGVRVFTEIGFCLNGYERVALVDAAQALTKRGFARLERINSMRLAKCQEARKQRELDAREALKKELGL